VWKIANRKVVQRRGADQRARAPFAEVDGLFAELAGADGDFRFSLIVNLAGELRFAGWEQAIAADEAGRRPARCSRSRSCCAPIGPTCSSARRPGKTADLARNRTAGRLR
jgi:hypothetical protein